MSGKGGGFEVHGGAHDLEAHVDDMHAVASRVESLGLDVGEIAVRTHAVFDDENLIGSAVLAPGSYAKVNGSLLKALDGWRGLSANALRVTAAGSFLSAAGAAYLDVDQASAYVDDVRKRLQVLRLAPLPIPGSVPFELLQTDLRRLFSDPEGWIVAHPDALEDIVGGSSGLLAGVLGNSFGLLADVEYMSVLLSTTYSQDADVPVQSRPREIEPPQDLGQAMENLRQVAENPHHFEIQKVGTGKDASYTIYLPGTVDFDMPWDESPLARNLGTNFAALGGVDNAYMTSVMEALKQAGVPADAPINLVGHSQGGIIAARVAQRLARTGSHELTVVTAGSPVDEIDLPPEVTMVSLVNEHDIVPRLDGEKYHDKSNHTTIVISDDKGEVIKNHSMDLVYGPLAQQLSASKDPEVRKALAPLRKFFTGPQGTAWTFEMRKR